MINTKMDRRKSAATTSENRRNDILELIDFGKEIFKYAATSCESLQSTIDYQDSGMDIDQARNTIFKLLEDLKQLLDNIKDVAHMSNNEVAEQPALFDALEFIQSAKQKFVNDQGKVEKMFQLLKDYNESKIDIVELVSASRKLLEGHNDILERFYSFLPESI